MRISDWSSDVCSSDLYAVRLSLDWQRPANDVIALRRRVMALRGGKTEVDVRYRGGKAACELEFGAEWKLRLDDKTLLDLQQWLGAACVRVHYKRFHAQIGRASGRERGCQYV